MSRHRGEAAPPAGGPRLDRPFAAAATSLATGERRVFTSGKVAPAVRASCAIPQTFSPCEIEGELYVDGGIVEFLPVRALGAFAPAITVPEIQDLLAHRSSPLQHLTSGLKSLRS